MDSTWIACLVLVALFAWTVFTLWLGGVVERSCWREAAVKGGFGKWIVNPDTGHRFFLTGCTKCFMMGHTVAKPHKSDNLTDDLAND